MSSRRSSATLRQLEYVGGLVTLADIAGTRREARPDLEAFLPGWFQRLAEAPRDWLRYRGRSLLVEAARLHRASMDSATSPGRPCPICRS